MKREIMKNSQSISKDSMKGIIERLSKSWVSSNEQQIMEFTKNHFHLQPEPEALIRSPAINSINHFKILFDFGYYLCMTPFQFVVYEDVHCSNICVSLKTSCLQISLTKILLWLNIIGLTWNSLIKIYLQSADIIVYFDAAHFLIHLVMMITFYYNFFSNSENCVKIMSELAQSALMKSEHQDESSFKSNKVNKQR